MLAVVPLRVQQPPRWVARYRPFGVVERGVTRPVAFLQTVASPGRAFNAAHPAVRASRVEDLGDLYAESGQTLQGSFSAVSKPNLQLITLWKFLAEIYTMHSFAPLWNPQSRTGKKRTWPKTIPKR